jgi:hypothetical protein
LTSEPRVPEGAPPISLAQLREYLSEKERLVEDVAILGTDELLALVEAVEAARTVQSALENLEYAEGHTCVAPCEVCNAIALGQQALARFDFRDQP